MKSHSSIRLLAPLLFLVSLCVLNPQPSSAQSSPVLISEGSSTRAIALESPNWTREPFKPVSEYGWKSEDARPRVMLFAINLNLLPGDDASALTAEAEDAAHRIYPLKVECVRLMPGYDWLNAIVVRLDDEMGDVGDVLVCVTLHGVKSNRVRMGIGHVGGGPPDDEGAAPTPIIFNIKGQVKDEEGHGLGGVTLTLSSGQQRSTTTGANGNYTFADVLVAHSYTVTASKTDYDFSQPVQSINNLLKDESVNFSGSLKSYALSGRVIDNNGAAFTNLPVTLSDGASARTMLTDGAGFYSFLAKAQGRYTVTPSNAPYLSLQTPSWTINFLSGGNQTLDFTATRKEYKISGKVKDDKGNGIEGVGVLLDYVKGGSWRYTGKDGSFSFEHVAGGYDYSLTASDINSYSFSSQSLSQLGEDLSVTFQGKLRSYSISGTLTDQAHNPLAGATVQLSGPFNLTTTTDSSGNYSFNNLPAKENYKLVPTKANYIFELSSQALNSLTFDRRADFSAFRTYVIKGQVKDVSGKGVSGISVTLSGPQAGKGVTDAGGTYSFTVTSAGNYQVTPSIEQDYYVFNPSTHSLSVSEDEQTASFTAALTLETNPSYVLEFNGSEADVEYGLFWPWNVDLGHFYWEFWAMPGDDTVARYLVSDGYGGAHALLFGFGYTNDEGCYSLFGNIYDGTSMTSFTSDEGPHTGEWSHVAVGWDGKYIVSYFDGVPVGKQPFKGPRFSPGPAWGASWLLIGGSDHQNLIGRIAQVRAFEGRNPREDSPQASFAPQTLFEVDGNLLSYYFRPAFKVADLSPGYFGRNSTGTLRGTANGVAQDCTGCRTPEFVIDPTAPNFTNPSKPGQINAPINSSALIPAGARIFDTFSRRNATYILGGAGGLGSSEGGSSGAQVWQTGMPPSQPQPFGILNGRAVLLKDERCVAWLNAGASGTNLDVRVDRHAGALGGSGVNTGLAFRVVDSNNYFFAYTSDVNEDDSSKPKAACVGYYLDGKRTDLAANLTLPNSWTTLRVVTMINGNINVYADNTLVYSTSSSVLSGATGAGLYNNAKGMALTNRWDNFIVYEMP